MSLRTYGTPLMRHASACVSHATGVLAAPVASRLNPAATDFIARGGSSSGSSTAAASASAAAASSSGSFAGSLAAPGVYTSLMLRHAASRFSTLAPFFPRSFHTATNASAAAAVATDAPAGPVAAPPRATMSTFARSPVSASSSSSVGMLSAASAAFSTSVPAKAAADAEAEAKAKTAQPTATATGARPRLRSGKPRAANARRRSTNKNSTSNTASSASSTGASRPPSAAQVARASAAAAAATLPDAVSVPVLPRLRPDMPTADLVAFYTAGGTLPLPAFLRACPQTRSPDAAPADSARGGAAERWLWRAYSTLFHSRLTTVLSPAALAALTPEMAAQIVLADMLRQLAAPALAGVAPAAALAAVAAAHPDRGQDCAIMASLLGVALPHGKSSTAAHKGEKTESENAVESYLVSLLSSPLPRAASAAAAAADTAGMVGESGTTALYLAANSPAPGPATGVIAPVSPAALAAVLDGSRALSGAWVDDLATLRSAQSPQPQSFVSVAVAAQSQLAATTVSLSAEAAGALLLAAQNVVASLPHARAPPPLAPLSAVTSHTVPGPHAVAMTALAPLLQPPLSPLRVTPALAAALPGERLDDAVVTLALRTAAAAAAVASRAAACAAKARTQAAADADATAAEGVAEGSVPASSGADEDAAPLVPSALFIGLGNTAVALCGARKSVLGALHAIAITRAYAPDCATLAASLAKSSPAKLARALVASPQWWVPSQAALRAVWSALPSVARLGVSADTLLAACLFLGAPGAAVAQNRRGGSSGAEADQSALWATASHAARLFAALSTSPTDFADLSAPVAVAAESALARARLLSLHRLYAAGVGAMARPLTRYDEHDPLAARGPASALRVGSDPLVFTDSHLVGAADVNADGSAAGVWDGRASTHDVGAADANAGVDASKENKNELDDDVGNGNGNDNDDEYSKSRNGAEPEFDSDGNLIIGAKRSAHNNAAPALQVSYGLVSPYLHTNTLWAVMLAQNNAKVAKTRGSGTNEDATVDAKVKASPAVARALATGAAVVADSLNVPVSGGSPVVQRGLFRVDGDAELVSQITSHLSRRLTRSMAATVSASEVDAAAVAAVSPALLTACPTADNANVANSHATTGGAMGAMFPSNRRNMEHAKIILASATAAERAAATAALVSAWAPTDEAASSGSSATDAAVGDSAGSHPTLAAAHDLGRSSSPARGARGPGYLTSSAAEAAVVAVEKAIADAVANTHVRAAAQPLRALEPHAAALPWLVPLGRAAKLAALAAQAARARVWGLHLPLASATTNNADVVVTQARVSPAIAAALPLLSRSALGEPVDASSTAAAAAAQTGVDAPALVRATATVAAAAAVPAPFPEAEALSVLAPSVFREIYSLTNTAHSNSNSASSEGTPFDSYGGVVLGTWCVAEPGAAFPAARALTLADGSELLSLATRSLATRVTWADLELAEALAAAQSTSYAPAGFGVSAVGFKAHFAHAMLAARQNRVYTPAVALARSTKSSGSGETHAAALEVAGEARVAAEAAGVLAATAALPPLQRAGVIAAALLQSAAPALREPASATALPAVSDAAHALYADVTAAHSLSHTDVSSPAGVARHPLPLATAALLRALSDAARALPWGTALTAPVEWLMTDVSFAATHRRPVGGTDAATAASAAMLAEDESAEEAAARKLTVDQLLMFQGVTPATAPIAWAASAAAAVPADLVSTSASAGDSVGSNANSGAAMAKPVRVRVLAPPPPLAVVTSLTDHAAELKRGFRLAMSVTALWAQRTLGAAPSAAFAHRLVDPAADAPTAAALSAMRAAPHHGVGARVAVAPGLALVAAAPDATGGEHDWFTARTLSLLRRDAGNMVNVVPPRPPSTAGVIAHSQTQGQGQQDDHEQQRAWTDVAFAARAPYERAQRDRISHDLKLGKALLIDAVTSALRVPLDASADAATTAAAAALHWADSSPLLDCHDTALSPMGDAGEASFSAADTDVNSSAATTTVLFARSYGDEFAAVTPAAALLGSTRMTSAYAPGVVSQVVHGWLILDHRSRAVQMRQHRENAANDAVALLAAADQARAARDAALRRRFAPMVASASEGDREAAAAEAAAAGPRAMDAAGRARALAHAALVDALLFGPECDSAAAWQDGNGSYSSQGASAAAATLPTLAPALPLTTSALRSLVATEIHNNSIGELVSSNALVDLVTARLAALRTMIEAAAKDNNFAVAVDTGVITPVPPLRLPSVALPELPSPVHSSDKQPRRAAVEARCDFLSRRRVVLTPSTLTWAAVRRALFTARGGRTDEVQRSLDAAAVASANATPFVLSRVFYLKSQFIERRAYLDAERKRISAAEDGDPSDAEATTKPVPPHKNAPRAKSRYGASSHGRGHGALHGSSPRQSLADSGTDGGDKPRSLLDRLSSHFDAGVDMTSPAALSAGAAGDSDAEALAAAAVVTPLSMRDPQMEALMAAAQQSDAAERYASADDAAAAARAVAAAAAAAEAATRKHGRVFFDDPADGASAPVQRATSVSEDAARAAAVAALSVLANPFVPSPVPFNPFSPRDAAAQAPFAAQFRALRRTATDVLRDAEAEAAARGSVDSLAMRPLPAAALAPKTETGDVADAAVAAASASAETKPRAAAPYTADATVARLVTVAAAAEAARSQSPAAVAAVVALHRPLTAAAITGAHDASADAAVDAAAAAAAASVGRADTSAAAVAEAQSREQMWNYIIDHLRTDTSAQSTTAGSNVTVAPLAVTGNLRYVMGLVDDVSVCTRRSSEDARESVLNLRGSPPSSWVQAVVPREARGGSRAEAALAAAVTDAVSAASASSSALSAGGDVAARLAATKTAFAAAVARARLDALSGAMRGKRLDRDRSGDRADSDRGSDSLAARIAAAAAANAGNTNVLSNEEETAALARRKRLNAAVSATKAAFNGSTTSAGATDVSATAGVGAVLSRSVNLDLIPSAASRAPAEPAPRSAAARAADAAANARARLLEQEPEPLSASFAAMRGNFPFARGSDGSANDSEIESKSESKPETQLQRPRPSFAAAAASSFAPRGAASINSKSAGGIGIKDHGDHDASGLPERGPAGSRNGSDMHGQGQGQRETRSDVPHQPRRALRVASFVVDSPSLKPVAVVIGKSSQSAPAHLANTAPFQSQAQSQTQSRSAEVDAETQSDEVDNPMLRRMSKCEAVVTVALARQVMGARYRSNVAAITAVTDSALGAAGYDEELDNEPSLMSLMGDINGAGAAATNSEAKTAEKQDASIYRAPLISATAPSSSPLPQSGVYSQLIAAAPRALTGAAAVCGGVSPATAASEARLRSLLTAYAGAMAEATSLFAVMANSVHQTSTLHTQSTTRALVRLCTQGGVSPMHPALADALTHMLVNRGSPAVTTSNTTRVGAVHFGAASAFTFEAAQINADALVAPVRADKIAAAAAKAAALAASTDAATANDTATVAPNGGSTSAARAAETTQVLVQSAAFSAMCGTQGYSDRTRVYTSDAVALREPFPRVVAASEVSLSNIGTSKLEQMMTALETGDEILFKRASGGVARAAMPTKKDQ